MHWVIQYTTGDYIGMAVFAALYLGIAGVGAVIWMLLSEKRNPKE